MPSSRNNNEINNGSSNGKVVEAPSSEIVFILHRPFVKEGDYKVQQNGRIASIKVSRIKNVGSLQKIFDGMEIIGTVEISHDYHGIANIWKITMTMPYIPKPDASRQFVQECLRYLNRLVEVVRYKTKKYWITPLSEHDILFAKIIDMVDDSGKHKTGFIMPEVAVYPIQILDEATVITDITRMVANEEKIPLSETLILDSYNYFSTGQYNEAAIISNLALELFVHEFLKEILQHKYKTNQELNYKLDLALEGRFHKVMRRNFFDDKDHEILKNTDPIYSKFCNARDTRGIILHSGAAKLDINKSLEVINEIHHVQNFLTSNSQRFVRSLIAKY